MSSDPISIRAKGDFTKMTAPNQPRLQSMQGFDEDYTDIVDYIIRCTHKIWEEKGVGLIYTHYQHNCVLHASGGDVVGVEAVVAGTLQTMAGFPDRKLIGDDVIWTGNDQDGFYSSHHITSVGSNTGYSAYGPPTYRPAVWRAIALCYVKENRIIEEWLLRDELALIRQLGLDENEIIERQARAELAKSLPVGFGETDHTLGQYLPPVMPPKTSDGFDVDDFVRRSFHEIWNWRLFNKVRDYYSPNFKCHTASDRRLYGHNDLANFIISVLACLPDAQITVEQVYWMGNEQDGFRVSTLWTLVGTHKGAGMYGPPSGARVRVMGLSQHTIRDGRFTEESTLIDEMGLRRQIVTQRLRQ